MDKILYVDEEGLKQLKEEILNIKEKLKRNALDKREAAIQASGNGSQDSFDFEDAKREEMFLQARLIEAERRLSRAVLIKRTDDEELVDIGDYIKILINYEDEPTEEIIQLSGTQNYDITKSIPEISINSPLGKTIYKQTVGFKGSYQVDNNSFDVEIISKLTKKEAYDILGIKSLTKE